MSLRLDFVKKTNKSFFISVEGRQCYVCCKEVLKYWRPPKKLLKFYFYEVQTTADTVTPLITIADTNSLSNFAYLDSSREM